MDSRNSEKKALSLLSIAAKAGKVISGSETVIEAVKSGKAVVLLVAPDASDRSKKVFKDKCSFYKVPVFEAFSKDELGKYTGKDERSAVALTDEGLGRKMAELLNEHN